MVLAGDLFIDLGFGGRIFSGKPMLSEENLPYLQAVKKVAALCEKYKVSSIRSPDLSTRRLGWFSSDFVSLVLDTLRSLLSSLPSLKMSRRLESSTLG